MTNGDIPPIVGTELKNASSKGSPIITPSNRQGVNYNLYRELAALSLTNAIGARRKILSKPAFDIFNSNPTSLKNNYLHRINFQTFIILLSKPVDAIE